MADSIDERSIRTDRRISRVLSPGHRKLNGEISSSYAARLECHSIFCRFLIYSRLLSLTASSYSVYAAAGKKKREKKKYDGSGDFILLPTKTYIEAERNSERMEIRRLRFVEFR